MQKAALKKSARRASTATGAAQATQQQAPRPAVYKHTGGVNAPLGAAAETVGMGTAEREQLSRKDKFWGVDKESRDRERDRELMSSEFERSLRHEQDCKLVLQQREWEEEYQKQLHDEAYKAAVGEMQTRREYMRSLFAASSSQVVMNYIWNPDTLAPQSFVLSASPQHNRHHQRIGDDYLSDSVSGVDSLVRLVGGSNFELPPVDNEYPMHTHSGGLMQSRAAATGELQQRALRNRSSGAGIAETAMSSSRKAPSSTTTGGKITTGGAGKKGTAGVHMGGGIIVSPVNEGTSSSSSAAAAATQGKATFKLTMANGHAVILPPPPGRKHIEAIDGHPKHGWDQEALLAAAFDLLDTRRAGVLTLPDISRLSSHAEARALLRFTVLGSLVKRKMWNSFRGIFHHPEANIGLSEWMSLASSMAAENRVPLKFIRLEEDHLSTAGAASTDKAADVGWLTLSATGQKGAADQLHQGGWFANGARKHLERLSTQASLRRWLRKGDVVWGLHGRGITWLPAIVESVNADETCDLSYPLSPALVSRAREASHTRRLVRTSLVSNQVNENEKEDQAKRSSEFVTLTEGLDELQACASVFDLLFGGANSVSPALFISGLYNPNNGVRALVDSNAVLKLVAPPLKEEAMLLITAGLEEGTSTSLRQDLFPPLASAITKVSGDALTRPDWLSYCSLVRDRATLSCQ